VGDATKQLEPDSPAAIHLVRRKNATGLEVKLDKREKMTQFSLQSLHFKSSKAIVPFII